MRHNLAYRGRRGRRRDFGACACRCRAISVISCNSSSTRKCERPADACTNGSGDAKLVQSVGSISACPCHHGNRRGLLPGEVLVYERELTPVKGMEDMSDLEGLCS